jgi:predicted DNA-binding transcriptional regulator YafY
MENLPPAAVAELRARKEVVIDYTNYRGERSMRRIRPTNLVWDSNEWHPVEQWLLIAWDLDKDASRAFAVSGIHSWVPLTASVTV